MKLKTEHEITMEIADRVRAIRTSRGLTQADVSKRSGVSLSSYRRFEQTGRIEFLSLVKVSQVLHAEGEFDKLFPPPIASRLVSSLLCSLSRWIENGIFGIEWWLYS